MNRRQSTLLVAVTLLFFCVAVDVAWAQAAAPAAAPTGGGRTVWDMIMAGGFWGFVIILLSFAGLALIIEHFVNLQRDKICPPEMIGELERLLEEGQYEEAVQVCESERTFLTNVVGAAVAKVGGGYDDMVKALEEVGEEESFKLNRKISWLSLIGNVAPMLGLLGTVWGMIGAFQVIEETANPTPRELARGIYTALITTCEGLIVAIPVLSFYFYFKNKVTALILETGAVAGELIERFKEAG